MGKQDRTRQRKSCEYGRTPRSLEDPCKNKHGDNNDAATAAAPTLSNLIVINNAYKIALGKRPKKDKVLNALGVAKEAERMARKRMGQGRLGQKRLGQGRLVSERLLTNTPELSDSSGGEGLLPG